MPQPRPREQARGLPGGRFFQSLGIAVVGLVAALVLLELAGMLLPALSADALDPERELLRDARVAPHPYLGYANKPGFRSTGGAQVAHNALGFRGPETTWDKPAGVYRIVCLGGSSTYGHDASGDAATWPARLQEHLNASALLLRVEVINAGCEGYSTFESLINLELRCVDLQPDLVVTYHAINDMRCALWTAAQPDNSHWRAVWPVERKCGVERWLERSTTWRLLRSLDSDWRAARSGDLGWYAIVDYGKEAWTLSPAAELGFASVRRNLETLVAVARAHASRIVLGLEGVRWSDFDRFDSAEAQKSGMRRVLDLTREVGTELGVPVIDLAAALEGEAERQRAETGRDSVFTSEVHLTDEGADLLARMLGQAIVDLGWIDGAGAGAPTAGSIAGS